ncbi:autoinducer binding domain-containing protein [Defluviimonas sp. WL0002]|uniref:Autoinducer binding domain-containing protein n=1 Tax=Albidovulum marisflavi TaxID=2984159 RepID=A0ABT2ZE24_9RHOB|nr:autoinducer binding domain-containing protein [Defluviimonas sp. WL0002]MCV2869331.1 autoinducer binding domain-containing protein [Defluviimonas sp. WL0002]
MPLRSGIELQLHELSLMSPLGYSVALHFRAALPLLLHQTYPADWVARYNEDSFGLRDPLFAWGYGTIGTARWSEIQMPDPFDILGQARDFGLIYGLVVSCGPVSSRTVASASRSDREFSDAEIESFARLIHTLHDMIEPPTKLTKAQADALRLIAEGHRYVAAAAKLNISESALKARLNSARQSLLARTTAEAVQRARDYRLI